MKKFLVSVLVLVSIVFVSSFAFAASSETIAVNAQVPEFSPTITIVILKFTDGDPDGNPWTNSSIATSMDFGKFTYLLADNSNAGMFYSPTGYCVNIYADSFGKPYEIRSSCLGVSDGIHSLPTGSFGLTPVYSETDEWKYSGGAVKQGSIPAGATLGTSGPAIDPNKLVYSSESGVGSARILQAYYGFPPLKAGGAFPFNGFVSIPLTQASGQYSGTVTLTIVVK